MFLESHMQLNLDNGQLNIKLSILEKILSVRGSLKIPLDRIDRATTEAPKTTWREIRAPGTFMPWVIKAGTYFTNRGKEFWYVTRLRNHLTMELKKGFYNRIVLSLRDNQQWADKINAAV